MQVIKICKFRFKDTSPDPVEVGMCHVCAVALTSLLSCPAGQAEVTEAFPVRIPVSNLMMLSGPFRLSFLKAILPFTVLQLGRLVTSFSFW